jgi:hypothetical protein
MFSKRRVSKGSYTLSVQVRIAINDAKRVLEPEIAWSSLEIPYLLSIAVISRSVLVPHLFKRELILDTRA